MYEDLRHHDVQCPNEPEFRLYDVLLKLNDGDTLQVTILGFWKIILNCSNSYSGDLKSDLVWIMVQKRLVRILDGIWNLEAQSFEIRTNGRHFVINHFKSAQKCPDFEWSGFQMLGTIAIAKAQPFEIRPSKSLDFWMFLDFKWSDFRSPTITYFQKVTS